MKACSLCPSEPKQLYSGFALPPYGLLRLESRYGKERLEAACYRALSFGLHSYKGVKNILKIMDDQYERSSTILATQIPVAGWNERMADPTLSDAIMDRIIHSPKIVQYVIIIKRSIY